MDWDKAFKEWLEKHAYHTAYGSQVEMLREAYRAGATMALDHCVVVLKHPEGAA